MTTRGLGVLCSVCLLVGVAGGALIQGDAVSAGRTLGAVMFIMGANILGGMISNWITERKKIK